MLLVLRKGGPGSGDFNHAGRPGEVGGSQETRGRVGVTHRYGKEGHKGEYEVPHSTKVDYFEKLGASPETAEDMAKSITRFSGSGSAGIRSCQMGTYAGHDLKANYTKMGHDIEKALKIMPKWAGTSPLYRGMGLKDAQIEKFIKASGTGLIIDMRGTSSWSNERKTAHEFASGGDNRAIFTLEGGSKYASSIKHLSSHSNENEVLMSTDARFTITGHSVDAHGTHHFTVKQKTKYAQTNLDEVEKLPEKPPAKLTPIQEKEKAKWEAKQAPYKAIMSDYDSGKVDHKGTKQKLAALISGKNYGHPDYDKVYSTGMSSMKQKAKELYGTDYVPKTQPKIAVKVTPKKKSSNDTSVADKKVKATLIAKIKKEQPYKYPSSTLDNASIKELHGYAKQSDPTYVSNKANFEKLKGEAEKKTKLVSEVYTHSLNTYTKAALESKSASDLEYLKEFYDLHALDEDTLDLPAPVKESKAPNALLSSILASPLNNFSYEDLKDYSTETLVNYSKKLEEKKKKFQVSDEITGHPEVVQKIKAILTHPKNTLTQKQLESKSAKALDEYHKFIKS